MRHVYRGHEITVERDGNAVTDSALFWSIFREDDGYQVGGGVYYGAETVRGFYTLLKERVDNEIDEGSTYDPGATPSDMQGEPGRVLPTEV